MPCNHFFLFSQLYECYHVTEHESICKNKKRSCAVTIAPIHHAPLFSFMIRESSGGGVKCICSLSTSNSSTKDPSSVKWRTTSCTFFSGALAPALIPTIFLFSYISDAISPTPSIRYAAIPFSRATCTRRLEFEDVFDPTTRITSATFASSLTAPWRFVVA